MPLVALVSESFGPMRVGINLDQGIKITLEMGSVWEVILREDHPS